MWPKSKSTKEGNDDSINDSITRPKSSAIDPTCNRVGILWEQVRLVTFNWYTITMSTGGIAVTLALTPHRFHGLDTIGKVFFIMDLVFFLSITICLCLRFATKRHALRQAFYDQTEGYFIGCSMLSVANIIVCINSYGVPSCGEWLLVALRIIFFIYTGVSLLMAFFLNLGHYNLRHGMTDAVPIVRVLPFFPAMLAGTIATGLGEHQPLKYTIDITITGITVQGLGFLASLIVMGEYFYYLSRHGLPPPKIRPQMFIAVGPWGFTIVALIGCAADAATKFPAHYIQSAKTVDTGDVAVVIAVFVGMFLWLMAFFHCGLAILGMLSIYRTWQFSIVWWSCIFPNVGFVLATARLGTELGSPGILWVASAMNIIVVAAWFILAGFTIWHMYTRRLLWPAEKQQ